MKRFGFLWRGRIVEECEATEWFEAVKIFDKRGLSIMGGDVVLL